VSRVDLETGKLLDHQRVGKLCEAKATIAPNGDVLLPTNGLTRCRPDLSVIWSQPEVPYSNQPPLLAPDGGAYLAGYSPKGTVSRVSADGELLWTSTVRRKQGNSMDTQLSFSQDGKQIYAGGNGVLYALDAEKGNVLWGKAGDQANVIQVCSKPVVTSRDEVVVSGSRNQVTCFYKNGKQVWKWSARFEKRSDELTRKEREEAFGWGNGLIESDPMLTHDGKTILVAGDEKLMALDLDGNLQWKKELPGAGLLRDQAIQLGPDGTIYVKTDSQTQVWALKPDGEQIWHYENRSPSGTAFMGVSQDTVVFVTREGSAVALRQDALRKRIDEAAARPDEAPTQIHVGNGVVTVGGIRLKTKR
jgi:outer membrane protein assembly factor BamB